MCGLLAASGKIKSEYIQALGCLNYKRGKDSAGVAWTDGKENFTHKGAIHPLRAFTVDFSDSIEKAAKSGVVIGHTRAATTGAINDDNSHPFSMDGIVFAHNGMISNYRKFGEYEVDSQALIHGIKKRDFSEYCGSIALVWLENNKLHAFRHGNPLYRGLKEGALYLASEEEMLKEIQCQNIRELADGHVYTIGGGGIIRSGSVPMQSSANYSQYSNHGYESYAYPKNIYLTAQKKKRRPHKKAECECGHKGKIHNQIVQTTGEWACYDKGGIGSALCPCNVFRDVREKVKRDKAEAEAEAKKEATVLANSLPWATQCQCGHAIRIHSWRGSGNSCNAPICQCVSFQHMVEITPPVSVAPVNKIVPPSEQWPGVPVSTQCECFHELEYHTVGASCGCGVVGCICTSFWPADENVFHSMANQ